MSDKKRWERMLNEQESRDQAQQEIRERIENHETTRKLARNIKLHNERQRWRTQKLLDTYIQRLNKGRK